MSYEEKNNNTKGNADSHELNHQGPSWDELYARHKQLWNEHLDDLFPFNSKNYRGFITKSNEIKSYFSNQKKIAPTKTKVLIQRETRTGKNRSNKKYRK